MLISCVPDHAYLLDGEVLTEIGPDYVEVVPVDMNNNGWVVGTCKDGLGVNNAFFYKNGEFSIIEKPTRSMEITPVAINDAGVMAGGFGFPGAAELELAIWDADGQCCPLNIQGEIRAINEKNQVVGQMVIDNKKHAFLYVHHTAQIVDLTPLHDDSSAVSINNNGVVVGQRNSNAFIYHEGKLKLLNDMMLSDAIGQVSHIADSGVLMGQLFGADRFYKPYDQDHDGLANVSEINIYETVYNDSDSDNDEMPDGWEVRYDLNPLDDTDDKLDPDGDGYNNIEEFISGTNPRDPDSIPERFLINGTPEDLMTCMEEGDALELAVDVEALRESDTLTYEYQWIVDGAAVDENTSLFTYTADNAAGGMERPRPHSVACLVKAFDDEMNELGSVTQRWYALVLNKNQAPVIDATPQVVKIGETLNLGTLFSDPDNSNADPEDDNILTVTYSGWHEGS